MSRNRRGSLLVVTLWLVTILGVLAVAIGRYLSMEVKVTKYHLAREQAKALARSGIYLAKQRLADDATDGQPTREPYDWLGDDWAWFDLDRDDPTAWVVPIQTDSNNPEAPRNEIRMHIVDEERKLNINTATKDQLTQLVGSPEIAQAIIDYRDEDTTGETATGTPPYYQKNGPVVSLAELMDIPGVSGDVFQKLQQFTFAIPQANPTSTLNINTAGRDILLAVGLSASFVDEILLFRQQGHYWKALAPTLETDDPTVPSPFDSANIEFLNAQAQALLGVASQAFSVVSEGIVNMTGAGQQRPDVRFRVEAVIQRKECPPGREQPCIVAWREGA